MDTHQRVLFVDATTNFYRVDRFLVGQPFFGPVDLGLHLAGRFNSLNIGSGLLAGSIFPLVPEFWNWESVRDCPCLRIRSIAAWTPLICRKRC